MAAGSAFPVCVFPGKGRQGLILAGWSEELAWGDPSSLRCDHPFRSLVKAETSTHTLEASISVPDVPVKATLFVGGWFLFGYFPFYFNKQASL